MGKEIYKRFACCLVTRGHSRALIVDTQRGSYYTVPLAICDTVLEKSNITIDEAKSLYQGNELEIIEEYFTFLLDNEIIFTCSEEVAELFPELSLDYDYPADISNAILRLSNLDIAKLSGIIDQLVDLFCYSVEITMLDSFSLSSFIDLMDLCQVKELEHVDLYLNGSWKFEELGLSRYPFLNSITFFNVANEQEFFLDELNVTVRYTKMDLSSNIHCGVINEDNFVPNILHFTESLQHNTCLHKKIAIDENGNIRNCPSMKESYGNISEISLLDALNRPGFKKYWNLSKDKISKCKDCEFRNICTDCRAYIDEPADIFSAPLKCGYDPYLCIWEDWSTNPLKALSINHYKIAIEKK